MSFQRGDVDFTACQAHGFRGSRAPFLRRSKAQTSVYSMAAKVRNSFIISANSRGLSLHSSAPSLHRHEAQPLHPLHRTSHLSKILGFTGDGHIAQPSTISSLPPPPSLLELWSLGAPNPSPFFFFTFRCNSDLCFLHHLDKGQKCSDNTLNL